ncbi:hypothetical protein CQ046_17760 [Chryseobacterium sp. MYb7]|uniref:hypothetical protein n=1 Tax=Chryseobacterium sp. MYb7 TaxID=1827290 RepID=UPI000D004D6C|nr:hypothetical protein [Chryseobacterium sp. MYb7]PRB00674.1 hypothetical protein CQ046_17760 [Chryseobacterium sp. MYb7]
MSSKESVNKNNIFFLLKIIIYAMGFLSLVGMSRIWIGPKENWDQVIENDFIPALLFRSIFLTMVGLLFLGLSLIVSKIYKRENHFPKELVGLLLFSFILNLIMMLGFIT